MPGHGPCRQAPGPHRRPTPARPAWKNSQAVFDRVPPDFTLPQGDLAVVQAALARGRPMVTVYDQDGRNVLAEGMLDLVNNQIDATPGTIKLKARFDNRAHAMCPGASSRSAWWSGRGRTHSPC